MATRTSAVVSAFARSAATLAFCLPLLVGCGEDPADAYGNFEAREVVVSAETAGRLLRFDVDEGQRLAAGELVAQVDTVPLALQRDELEAQRGASRTRTLEAGAGTGALEAQLATALDEYRRTRRLYEAEAATAQQLNQREGEVRVLREQLAAARARTETTREEGGGVDARLAQIAERIRRSSVTNPVAGTVLTTYAEAGEFVQPGQPLYRVADLSTLTLRAYVSGAQLAGIALGQTVRVSIDAGEDERIGRPGRVTWISAEAEFTPTPIQTRDERTDLVYAVEIRVDNPDGAIKIGMPGEVVFGEDAATDVGPRP